MFYKLCFLFQGLLPTFIPTFPYQSKSPSLSRRRCKARTSISRTPVCLFAANAAAAPAASPIVAQIGCTRYELIAKRVPLMIRPAVSKPSVPMVLGHDKDTYGPPLLRTFSSTHSPRIKEYHASATVSSGIPDSKYHRP